MFSYKSDKQSLEFDKEGGKMVVLHFLMSNHMYILNDFYGT